MPERKYPFRLFLIGFLTNMIFRYFWLLLPGAILLIIGIFVKPCLYAGLALVGVNIALSLFEQMRIRQAVLSESDNDDFRRFQDALSKDGDWHDNMKDFFESLPLAQADEEDQEGDK